MKQSKLKETISRKHKITKTHADAATVTPLQDLLSCIFLSVYYLDPRLFIHRSLMKHRELRCILGGFYLMAGLPNSIVQYCEVYSSSAYMSSIA